MNEPVTSHYDPLDAVVAEYLQALEAGFEPSRGEYLARYPALANQLQAFFQNFDAMGRDASRFRLPASGAQAETLSLGEVVNPHLPRLRYLGDYELLHEIARGGMGVVYRARQVSLNRVVAIKMILAGTYASEQAVQRFRAEATAAANLDHPNILPIYEVGAHEGHQYFSMKLVEGGSLAAALGELTPQQAVILLTLLAHAVHFAHQRGILHRDLKPANVLLDRDGTPFITDFGLAKNVDADDGSTRTGTIVGTPSYMAPEQARGEKGLTTSVDVYSLGAILYEMLTGRPPFKGETVFETVKQVIERDPVDPLTLSPTTDRDLATIALKCLHKAPAQRYPSALALAEDLERWQRGEPILARPITRRERASKWVKRNRLAASLSAAVLFALLAGFVASTIFAWQAKQSLTQANKNLDRAIQSEADAQQRANEAAQAQQAEAQAHQAEKWSTYCARISLACNEWRLNNPARVRALLEECEPPLRGWEWHYVQRLLHGEKACVLADPDSISVLAFSHDSSRVLTGGRDGRVRIWDAHTAASTAVFRGHGGAIRSATFTADGKHVLSASRQELFVWDARTGQPVAHGSLPDKDVRYLAGSARGQLAVTMANDMVRVFADDGFRFLYEVAGTYAVYAPDGQSLVTITQGNIVVRNAVDGQTQHTFMGDGHNYFRVFLAGGKLAARGDDHGHWRTTVWDLATKKELCAISGDGLALSADGVFVAAGEERQVIFYDAKTGRESHRLSALNGRINTIQFSPDGLTMATGAGHLLTSDSLTAGESDSDGAQFFRALVGGAWRASPSAELRLWHRIPGRETRTIADRGFYATALSSRNIVALGRDRAITLHDLAGRTVGTLQGHEQKVMFLRFTPDGSRLVSASADQTIRVWDVAQGKEIGRGPVSDSPVMALTILNDQRTVATTFDQKVTRYWDIHTGKDLAVSFGAVEGTDHLVAMPLPTQLIRSTSGSLFYSDKTYVTAGQATVIDADDGRVLRTFAPAAGLVQQAVVSPNGQSLALLIHHPEAKESIVQFLDTATGQETRRLTGYSEGISCLAFTPDGRRIAMGTEQTTKLLDAATGALILSVPRPTTWLQFTSDGRSLVGVSENQVVVFDSDPPPAVQPLPAPMQLPADPPLPKSEAPDTLPDAVRFWLTKAAQASAANDPAAAWLYRLRAAQLDANPDRANAHRIALHLHRQASPALGGASVAVTTTPLLQPEKNMLFASYFSHDGRWAALHNTEPLYAYDLRTGRPLGKPTEVYPNDSARPCVLFTPDGRRMITLTFEQNEKELITVLQAYDTMTGQAVGKAMHAGYPLNRFSSVFVYPRMTENGRYVQLDLDDSARMGYSGRMATPKIVSRAFDLHTATELILPRNHNRVALSPCGRYALAAWSAAVGAGRSIDGAAVFDLTTGKQHGSNLQIPDEFYELQLSRDGHTALVVDWRGSNTVRCYRVADGRCLVAWKPSAHIAHAALSPDGRFVAVVAQASDWNNAKTGELHVRSTGDGERVGRGITLYHSVDRFDFSRDGRWLLVTCAQEQFLVEVATGERISPHLSIPYSNQSEPFALHADATFTFDDRLLIRRPVASQHGAMFGLYEFTPETLSFEQSQQRAELVAGRQLNDQGELVPIPLAEYQARWQKARQEHPDWFAANALAVPTAVPVPPMPPKRRPTPPARIYPKADYDTIFARHQGTNDGVWLRVAEALRHERADVRWAALQYTLARRGLDPLVIDLLAEGIRTGLAEMAYPVLLKHIKHATALLPAVRAELQAGYDYSCQQAAIDELNYRPTLSKEGVILLGRFGPAAKEAVPLLLKYLEQIPRQSYSDVEREAIRALGRIGPDAHTAVPVLLAKLSKHTRSDQLTRIILDRSLDRIMAGQEATFTEAIRQAFPDVKLTSTNDWQAQRREMHALGLTQLILRHERKFADLAPLIRAKLDESTPVKNLRPNPALRAHLAEALWRTTGRTEDALSILKSELTRQGGAIAHTSDVIARMGKTAESLLPDVQAALKKATQPADQLAAAEAVWRLSGEHALVLQHARTMLNHEGEPRLRAIRILGELGPNAQEAVPRLVELVQAEDASNARKTLRMRVNESNDPDDKDVLSDPSSDSLLRDTILPALRKIDPKAAERLKPVEKPTLRLN